MALITHDDGTQFLDGRFLSASPLVTHKACGKMAAHVREMLLLLTPDQIKSVVPFATRRAAEMLGEMDDHAIETHVSVDQRLVNIVTDGVIAGRFY